MTQPTPRRVRPLKNWILLGALVLALITVAAIAWPRSSPAPAPQGPESAGVSASMEVACDFPVERNGNSISFCVERSSVPLQDVSRLEVSISDGFTTISRETICPDGIPVGSDVYCAVVLFFTADCGDTLIAEAVAHNWDTASYVAGSRSYQWGGC